MTIRHVPEQLLKAQRLANIFDSAVRIPIIGIRVGMDFLVGLIPVLGDAIMLLASLRIVQLAKQMGVPPELRDTMMRNCVIDFALGFIPFLGDVADVFFKANKANVRIMERWWLKENREQLKIGSEEALKGWVAGQETT